MMKADCPEDLLRLFDEALCVPWVRLPVLQRESLKQIGISMLLASDKCDAGHSYTYPRCTPGGTTVSALGGDAWTFYDRECC